VDFPGVAVSCFPVSCANPLREKAFDRGVFRSCVSLLPIKQAQGHQGPDSPDGDRAQVDASEDGRRGGCGSLFLLRGEGPAQGPYAAYTGPWAGLRGAYARGGRSRGAAPMRRGGRGRAPSRESPPREHSTGGSSRPEALGILQNTVEWKPRKFAFP